MVPEAQRRVFDGELVSLVVERWDGHEREIVEHPGSVAVVAVDASGRVVLVRQFRAPARRVLLELPAGTLAPGEQSLATARRELQEETGLTGGRWRELAAFWTTPGFCREHMRLFLAEGVDEGEARPEPDEAIAVVRWTRDEAAARLAEVEDAKTLAGLLLWLAGR